MNPDTLCQYANNRFSHQRADRLRLPPSISYYNMNKKMTKNESLKYFADRLDGACNNELALFEFLAEFPFVVPLGHEYEWPQVVLPYTNIDDWEKAQPKTHNYQCKVETIAPLTPEQRKCIDRDLRANFRWDYRLGTRNKAN